MVLPKLTPELMQASMPRVMRALADHCLRPAKQHFAEWQRHKRNANVAMAQDAEQMMWLRLLDWADFSRRARNAEAINAAAPTAEALPQ